MKPYKNSKMDKLTEKLNLNMFQQGALFHNPEKYNLDKLVKKGVVVYAPLVEEASCPCVGTLRDMVYGEKADLIGENKILAHVQRGIKLYATGFYRAKAKNGRNYYADSSGRKLTHEEFKKIVH